VDPPGCHASSKLRGQQTSAHGTLGTHLIPVIRHTSALESPDHCKRTILFLQPEALFLRLRRTARYSHCSQIDFWASGGIARSSCQALKAHTRELHPIAGRSGHGMIVSAPPLSPSHGDRLGAGRLLLCIPRSHSKSDRFIANPQNRHPDDQQSAPTHDRSKTCALAPSD
jgi:hypothetical protein